MATHQDADKAVSWMLHALKIVLGDESIRRYIILYYYPTITNPSKKCIRIKMLKCTLIRVARGIHNII